MGSSAGNEMLLARSIKARRLHMPRLPVQDNDIWTAACWPRLMSQNELLPHQKSTQFGWHYVKTQNAGWNDEKENEGAERIVKQSGKLISLRKWKSHISFLPSSNMSITKANARDIHIHPLAQTIVSQPHPHPHTHKLVGRPSWGLGKRNGHEGNAVPES